MNKINPDTSIDSKILLDIIAGAIGYRAVFVAYELGLFELLAQKPHSLTEVSQMLDIAERPADALLLANLSLELLQRNNDLYSLTETSRHYLLKESSTYTTVDSLTWLAIHSQLR